MTTPTTAEEGDYHRRYFAGPHRTRRIALGTTPSVQRHVAETVDPLQLGSGARILELGCGLGRFTQALLDRGYRVTALDLSELLIDGLRSALGPSDRLEAVAGKAEDLATLAPGPFDAVVGFFFLHHLPELAPVFDSARRVLADGGLLAFCEPNAFNPLVYAQVTFTPGMSWKGEPGIPQMRPGIVFPILRDLGFTDLRTRVYGMLPPLVANTKAGGAIERRLEQFGPLRPLSAYRVFHARWP